MKIKIAALLIEWMEDSNLINRSYIKIDNKIYNILNASESVENEKLNMTTELLNPSDSAIKSTNHKGVIDIVSPMRLPTIVPPKKYVKKDNGKYILGGYLLNDIMTTDDIILENHELKEQSVIKNENLIYDVVNNVNSVSYKINTDMLSFIKEHSNYYEGELLDQFYIHPLIKKDKLSKSERSELLKYTSKLELQQQILNIADLYSIIPEFYFVNRIDNRGRLYCITEFLNYQSCELAKSLLLFSKSNEIIRNSNSVALKYFKMYGANSFGNKIDKVPVMIK